MTQADPHQSKGELMLLMDLQTGGSLRAVLSNRERFEVRFPGPRLAAPAAVCVSASAASFPGSCLCRSSRSIPSVQVAST